MVRSSLLRSCSSKIHIFPNSCSIDYQFENFWKIPVKKFHFNKVANLQLMMISYIDGWWNQCIRQQLTVWSFTYLCKALHFLDVCSDVCCLLSSIVLYCFTYHYLGIIKESFDWHILLPVTSRLLSQNNIWPLRSAQYSSNQWKTAISCYQWHISAFKSSKMPARSHHLFI